VKIESLQHFLKKPLALIYAFEQVVAVDPKALRYGFTWLGKSGGCRPSLRWL
jgi:hypothetical protein